MRCIEYSEIATKGRLVVRLTSTVELFSESDFLGGRARWDIVRGKQRRVKTEFKCITSGEREWSGVTNHLQYRA